MRTSVLIAYLIRTSVQFYHKKVHFKNKIRKIKYNIMNYEIVSNVEKTLMFLHYTI